MGLQARSKRFRASIVNFIFCIKSLFIFSYRGSHFYRIKLKTLQTGASLPVRPKRRRDLYEAKQQKPVEQVKKTISKTSFISELLFDKQSPFCHLLPLRCRSAQSFQATGYQSVRAIR